MPVPVEKSEVVYIEAEGLLSDEDKEILVHFDEVLGNLGMQAGEVHGEELEALIERAHQLVPGSREAAIRRDVMFDTLMVAERDGKSLPL